MKILVRLPNWLGDMVMSIGFTDALQKMFPEAAISVIAKKGIHTLLEFFPVIIQHRFVFSKDEYPGLPGAWRFGKLIRDTERFDLFFCLPDSFSSALIGFAAGAKQRIGYGKELRSVLLTNAFERRKGLHRVEEYIDLLQQYSGKKWLAGDVVLSRKALPTGNDIVININSEASSRRLPVLKAVSLINAVRRGTDARLILVGGKTDSTYVEGVVNQLASRENIINITGQTTLPELIATMAAARLVLTTDSGPAHLANAAGVPTIVLFGAGNELNTAPFNEKNRSIIRLGELPCEPCGKNTCVLFGIPKCLEQLDEDHIVQTVLKYAGK